MRRRRRRSHLSWHYPVGVRSGEGNESFKVGDHYAQPRCGDRALARHLDQDSVDPGNNLRAIPYCGTQVEQMVNGGSPADQLTADRSPDLLHGGGELSRSRRLRLGGNVLNHPCMLTRFDTHVESLG